MAQFTTAENNILDALSIASFAASLDFQELVVLRLLMQGYDKTEVAAHLHIGRRYLYKIIDRIRPILRAHLQ
jgi:DNA-binding CsgD family transcriptional regulator